MKILRIINPDKISEVEVLKLKPRLSSRGVVFNKDNSIALLHVSKHTYYKLPGGGIEEGEDSREAFRRECIEEIGFDVEIVEELGSIIEYRSQFEIIQTSFCYTAKVIGERKETAFTEHEVSQGFEEPIWLPLNEALKLVSESNPNDYEGVFIKERDTLILETAKSNRTP